MNYLNKALSKIKIVEILIIFLSFFLIILFLRDFFGIYISEVWIYLFLIVFIIFKVKSAKEDFLFDLKHIFSTFSLKDILIIVFLNIFFAYGMLYIAELLLSIPFFSGLISNSFLSPLKNIAIVGTLLASIVIAPIFEELLFRGIFLQKLKSVFTLPTAIIIVSILFGAVHNFEGIISAIVFGICMCILFIRSGNILVPIFAHFLNNLFAEIIAAVDYNDLIFSNTLIIIIFSILAIISAYFLITSFISEFKNLKGKHEI